MKAKFWMVWSPRGRGPRHKHQSAESAYEEADRLAKANTGRHFYVLEMMGFALEGEETLTAKQMVKLRAQKEKEATTEPLAAPPPTGVSLP